MGRLLVWWFLGTVTFAVATFLASVVYLVLYAGRSLGAPWVGGQPLVLGGSGIANVWFTIALVYFVWIVPLALVLVLIPRGRRERHREVPADPAVLEDWANRSLIAVLTAYNDEEAIGPSVQEFLAVPHMQSVIVVDNNCTDRTAEVARAHGAVVVPEPRQGYGLACMRGLRTALETATADFIILAEGDMTFFGNDVPKLLPYLEECDLVLGTRTNRTLTQKGSQMDWFLAWGNLALAFLIRLRYWDRDFLGHVQLTDVGCTFRVIRRKSLAGVIDRLSVGGYYFSPHMILVALQNGLKVVEVPIKFRARVGMSKGAGRSRRRALSIGLSMMREISLH